MLFKNSVRSQEHWGGLHEQTYISKMSTEKGFGRIIYFNLTEYFIQPHFLQANREWKIHENCVGVNPVKLLGSVQSKWVYLYLVLTTACNELLTLYPNLNVFCLFVFVFVFVLFVCLFVFYFFFIRNSLI